MSLKEKKKLEKFINENGYKDELKDIFELKGVHFRKFQTKIKNTNEINFRPNIRLAKIFKQSNRSR